jgi:putative membrane protein
MLHCCEPFPVNASRDESRRLLLGYEGPQGMAEYQRRITCALRTHFRVRIYRAERPYRTEIVMKNLSLATFVMLAMSSMSVAFAAESTDDKTFATKAAQAGIAEVAAGDLARTKATNEDVKGFADKMVRDHSAANAELRDAAAKSSVVLPTDVSIEQKAAAERLSTFSGAEFDHAYVEQMVKDHTEAVELLRTEAAGGKDAHLKAFAQKTLPTIEMHLEMAKKLDRDNK